MKSNRNRTQAPVSSIACHSARLQSGGLKPLRPEVPCLRTGLQFIQSMMRTVVLFGEAGAGKSHVANALHGQGDGPFKEESRRDKDGTIKLVAHVSHNQQLRIIDLSGLTSEDKDVKGWATELLKDFRTYNTQEVLAVLVINPYSRRIEWRHKLMVVLQQLFFPTLKLLVLWNNQYGTVEYDAVEARQQVETAVKSKWPDTTFEHKTLEELR
jgi:50S ribosome-binding GTPase